jgi:hypothetical protein
MFIVLFCEFYLPDLMRIQAQQQAAHLVDVVWG